MKKIMFNDRYGLTQAVLEGRKTMTRRIISTDETKGGIVPVSFWSGKWCGAHGRPLKRQPYKIGEVVAVAQSYKQMCDELDADLSVAEMYIGAAGWGNKMFVKAEDMLHKIRITNVRIERLHSITVADCFKEGINTIVEGKSEIGNPWGWDTKVDYFKRDNYLTPLQAFAALIDKVSGKGTWESNPYVFVYEFELAK